jgi:arylacetamide deacetylase-like 2
MGLMKFEEFFAILMEAQNTKPVSDENITVIDTDFSDIPVRLYLPKRKSEKQRPAVIFIHGGAYILGSFSKYGFKCRFHLIAFIRVNGTLTLTYFLPQ